MTEETLTTPQLVEMYYQKALKVSRPWHNQIKKRRKLYDMDHYDVRARAGESRYEDPTYTNVVDLAVGIILANDLVFRAYGWSPSNQEQKQSSQIEKFLSGLIQINGDREECYLPYEGLLNLVRDGMAVGYTCWDAELAKQNQISMMVPSDDPESTELTPVEGYREPPLRVQMIDPLCMSFIPGGPGRWLVQIRTEEYSILDIEMQYGVVVRRYMHLDRWQKESTTGKLHDFWRMVEHPSIEGGEPKRVVEHAIVFEGEVIQNLSVAEGYDDLPFTVGFFKPVDKNDPKKWSHSIIDPLASTVAMLERSINRRQYQIDRYSALPMVAFVQPGRDISLDPALGSIQKLSPDEALKFAEWQGNPPDVERQIEFYRSRAQQSGFSDVMFGSAGAMSGYGLSQLGDQNRIRLEQPVQHLQSFWSRIAKKALHLCENFAAGKVIRVYGQMKGKDFMEQVFAGGLSDYNVRCFVKPEFPNDKVRNHAMANQVRGFLSDSRIMENYLGVEQPDDERERKLQEQMEMHPAMIQYGVIRQLRMAAEAGNNDAALALQVFMEQQNPGGRPPEPQGPPNPDQTAGMMSAGGGFTNQEMGMAPPGQGEMDMMQGMAGAAPNLAGGIQ